MVKILEPEDILRLLRKHVKEAGGQTAWSRKKGIDRTLVSHILSGRKPPTKSIIWALNLRIGVYAPQRRRARGHRAARAGIES